MDSLTIRLAAALTESNSYALEGSTPLVASTRSFVCELAGEALAEFRERMEDIQSCTNQDLSPMDALHAILARLNGEFDNPALVRFGPLGDTAGDCIAIAERGIVTGQVAQQRPS